jgi:pseudaminic acid cytidylyltransferase
MCIAVIPARGGSKRIHRKNIKKFNGIPMIAYAIRAAQNSNAFDEILVSTDDPEIAEISLSLGATIPWMRPTQLSGDHTTTVEVMQHAALQFNLSKGNVENICCLYPTTPLLEPEFLVSGLREIKSGDWDYVVSVTQVESHPSRFFYLNSRSVIQMYFPEHETTRTQDVPTTYRDAGQFYWGKSTAWASGKPIFSSNSTILELPPNVGIDIDTEQDWAYVEKLYKKRHGSASD